MHMNLMSLDEEICVVSCARLFLRRANLLVLSGSGNSAKTYEDINTLQRQQMSEVALPKECTTKLNCCSK